MKLLGIHDDETIKAAFRVFDASGDGQVDFKFEFLRIKLS